MTPTNIVCLWFDRDALDAANFYAATIPDSSVGAGKVALSGRAEPGGRSLPACCQRTNVVGAISGARSVINC